VAAAALTGPIEAAGAVSTLSEFALIERFFRRSSRSAVLGIGDDAALLAPTAGCEIAVSVDMLVAGRHFFPDVDPRALGHKALAVNLSDMAAMGAQPRWALLGAALPDVDSDWLAAFSAGLFALADEFGVELVGGDTTRGPLNVCVTIIGEAPSGRSLRRSGAVVGDRVWVSGPLGGAALALQALQGRIGLTAEQREACERCLLWPQPRVALGLRLRGIATSCIDISDGLVGDLGHILEASAVGAEIDLAAIPRLATLDRAAAADKPLVRDCILAGGDDYELCFTAPADSDGALAALAVELGLALAAIGTITASGRLVARVDGVPMPALPHGFDHFRG